MKYAEVTQDTPRLVVMFHSPAPGHERFQWGIVGKIPILSTIGYITYIQAELVLPSQPTCDQLALVIVWDADRTMFDYFVHPSIPVNSLVGMLELIKAALVDSQMAQHVRNQQVGLCGPDGQPIMR